MDWIWFFAFGMEELAKEKIVKGYTTETIEEDSEQEVLCGCRPNYTEKPFYKRSVVQDEDLEVLGMHMDTDLENLDAGSVTSYSKSGRRGRGVLGGASKQRGLQKTKTGSV